MLYTFLFSQYFSDPFLIPNPFGTYYNLKPLKWYHSFLLLIFVFWLYISLGFNLVSFTVFSVAQYLVFEKILH